MIGGPQESAARAPIPSSSSNRADKLLQERGTWDTWTRFDAALHGEVTSLQDPGPYMLCGEDGQRCGQSRLSADGLCDAMTLMAKDP